MDPVNPYRSRIFEFPGRLFSFEDFDRDREGVLSSLLGAKQVFVELGSGSGMHLLSVAASNPSAACFGFELRYKRAVRTIEKAKREGIANVSVLRTDARSLERVFQPEQIDGVYVNFPDPWQKARHKKHRLLSRNLLDICHETLRPNGFLSVKTDHAESFEEFMKLACLDSRYELADRLEKSFDTSDPECFVSEFELLFRSKSVPIHHARLVRV